MARSLRNWMSRLADDARLSDISIPGTHDSATYAPTFGRIVETNVSFLPGIAGAMGALGTEFIRCQTLTLREQLDSGIRFLDLRIRDGDDFPIYHGSIPLQMTLSNALDQVDAFLNDNPTETVIVSIKKESNSGRKETADNLVKFLRRRSKRMFTECRIPELHEVRGKAVLFNRVHEVADGGIFLWFEDNQTFSKTQRQGDGVTDLKFVVQDVYEPKSDDVLAAKQNTIREAYRNHQSEKDVLRISFLSASTPPLWPPRRYAKNINPYVGRYIQDDAGGKAWITILDYAGNFAEPIDDPVSAVISHNAFTDLPVHTRDTLRRGEKLLRGEALVSRNRAFEARFQDDQNLVVVRSVDELPIATSMTADGGADRAEMQADGNFVLYAGSHAKAATMTTGGERIVMQDDGNLVVMDAAKKPIWASRTCEFRH